MGNGGRGTFWRVSNVVGAIFQVGATGILGAAIREKVDQGTPLIEPALYAFFVWGVIFGLSLAYAVYQALPANRENRLLARIRQFTAMAFLFTGMWSVLVPLGQITLALAMLLGIYFCLLVAYLRIAVRSEREVLGGAGRWLVAAPVGIFLGWITAANVVSISSQAVSYGLVQGGSAGEAVLGSILLLTGSLVAAAVVVAGKDGPPQGYLFYGATVLWALVGIVVNQYDTSLLTAGAAVISILPVLLALLSNVRTGIQRGTHSSNGRGPTATRA